MEYNYELIRSLNEEYSVKPLVTEFRIYTEEEQLKNAAKKLESLNQKIQLQGLKVLEIGAGGGYLAYLLAEQYDCDVTGIDINRSDTWDELQHKNLRLLEFNICEENILVGEEFDLIVSYVAWEHIKKPFEALVQAKKLLKRDGKFYLYAWLYRSPMASHLYRNIFFPYPHLLFDDELVKRYALELGVEQSWIDSFYDCNKLTYAEYKEYFKLLGFKVLDEYLKFRSLDVDFYERFEDKLGLYPVYDLTLDYFAVMLENDGEIGEMRPYGIGDIVIKENDSHLKGQEIEVKLPTIDKNLEYAWDILCNGEKIAYVRWGEDSALKYTPEKEGNYIFKAYIRKPGCSARAVRKSGEVIIE